MKEYPDNPGRYFQSGIKITFEAAKDDDTQPRYQCCDEDPKWYDHGASGCWLIGKIKWVRVSGLAEIEYRAKNGVVYSFRLPHILSTGEKYSPIYTEYQWGWPGFFIPAGGWQAILPPRMKCTCGTDSCNGGEHSEWCDKNKWPDP